MNGTGTDQGRLELPEAVREQLGRFRRGLWWMETAVAVLGGAGGALAAYLALFLSDRFWETPAWLRMLLAVGSIGSCAGFAAYWLEHWGWRRRDARQLACLVQKRYPRLGDRLLGIVELAEAGRAPANVSAGLCRAAMQQVAAEAAGMDFAEAVPKRQRRRYGLVFLGLAGGAAVGIGLLPPAGMNALQRLLHPRSLIGRYTLAHLEALAASQVVPYGEPFEVRCRLAPDSRWVPSQARCRYAKQAWIEGLEAGGNFQFRIPGQTHPGKLTIAAGDARQYLDIRPEFRPELVKLRAAIDWPEYLGYAPLTQDVRNGTIEVLEGSRVEFEGQVSRALQEASEGTERMAVRGGDRFAASARTVTNTETVALAWRDVLGLSSREPFLLKLETRADEPPVVDCRGVDRVVALLQEEVLDFEVSAIDDYGVQVVSAVWEGEGNPQTGVPKSRGELAVKRGGQQQKEVAGPARFSPLALGLGPQKVTLRGVATDYYPGRKAAQSPAYQIYILDRQEHAKLVQQQFEKLQEKLEEIARAEEELLEANQQLRGELDKPEAAGRLEEQERGEEANAEALRRMQEAGLKLLREAMRNPDLQASSLRQWAEMLEQLEKLAQEGMPAVARALGKAQAEAGKRPEHMQDALARQQAVVEQMRQMLKKMNQTADQLAAASFVNRLRRAATEESGVATGLSGLLPETIGVPVAELKPAPKVKLARLEQRQSQNHRQVKYIQEDLESFFNRTRQERFGDVQQEMVKSKVVEELRRLADLIGQNSAGQSVEQAAHWSRQLDQWAEHLAVAAANGNGGEGGGQCEMSPAALELLMKLIRIRQTEEGLRDQTRVLEENRQGNEHYGEAAGQLAKIQGALVETVQETGRGWSEDLVKLLDDVATAMGDAAGLLAKPQTDGETVGAETEAIELLAAAVEKSCSGSSAGAGAGAGIQVMMRRLMGTGAGAQGGGSNRGGDTARPNDPVLGGANGLAGERRPVGKAVGHSRESLPAEFRDAIEAYINAVEGAK